MQYRTFERNHATTSLLGFGCMRFPVIDGDNARIDEEKTFAMLDKAYENGVNYYDTAYPYHQQTSEIVVGKWLQTKDRSSLYLTSKSPVFRLQKAEDFDAILDEQLGKLQTDYLDYYLLHSLNKNSWQKVKDFHLLERIQAAKDCGKIKRIGFSFHDDYETFDEIIHAFPWDSCQIQFNYMDTEIQAGMKGYELAKSMGIPMSIMEPIKGGQLANVPQEIRSVFNELHPDWSDASWALRWVASHDNVFVVLSGMSAMEQVEDNLETFSNIEPLNEAELEAIEKAKELFNARIQVPCTGCRYCLPCPFGINIPGNFSLLNEAYVYDIFDSSKRQYANLKDAKAELCRKCGACLAKCPQHLQIPTLMEKVAATLK